MQRKVNEQIRTIVIQKKLRVSILRIAKHENALATSISLQSSLHSIHQFLLLRPTIPLHSLHRNILKLALPRQVQNLMHASILLLWVLITPSANPESIEADVLEDEQTHWQTDRLLRHGTVGNHRRACCEVLGHVVDHSASNAVHPQPNGFPTAVRKFFELVAEVFAAELFVCDYHVRSQSFEILDELLMAAFAFPYNVDALVSP